MRELEPEDLRMKAGRSENSLVIAWLLNSKESAIAYRYTIFVFPLLRMFGRLLETYSNVEQASQTLYTVTTV